MGLTFAVRAKPFLYNLSWNELTSVHLGERKWPSVFDSVFWKHLGLGRDFGFEKIATQCFTSPDGVVTPSPKDRQLEG